MKFIFSMGLLLFLPFTKASAKEVILITYHPEQTQLAHNLSLALHNNMDFPKNLVTFVESDTPCERKAVSAAHICLDKNGEMEFPIIYTDTMKETLGVFWEDMKNEVEKI